jgi:phospholipid/cholesterol/gamma-HCH transport system substrate-binding protein
VSAPRTVNRTVLGTITLVIGIGLMLGVMAGVIGPQMFGGGGRQVTAVFSNAEQLIPGDEVRVQGVTVGTVTSIRLNPGAHSSTVVMTVADSAGPLYGDATATVAWKTVLGGAFRIDLTRGTPASGPLGSAAIPVSRTTDQVELDDLLRFDSGAARTGLQRLPGQLATALSEPKPPAQLLSTLAQVSPAVAAGVGAARGVVPDTDLRNLVSGAARTVQALDAPADELRGLVQGAAATVGVTAVRAADLRSALDGATPAMDQTTTTFTQLRETFRLANPLLRTLDGPAGEVAPTVAKLYPTVVGARRLLHTAVPLLHALPPALTSLASTSQRGLPLLDAIQPTLDRLQNVVLPYMNTVDPATQHTTAEMIGPTTEALGPDIAGQMDQNGHFIRFPATGGSSPLYLPCQTYFGNPAAGNKLVACESLSQALSSILQFNPLQTAAGHAMASHAAGGHARAGGAAAAGAGSGGAAGAGQASQRSAAPAPAGGQAATDPLTPVLGAIDQALNKVTSFSTPGRR